MATHLKQLEDCVTRAIDRIAALTRQRDDLQRKMSTLEDRLKRSLEECERLRAAVDEQRSRPDAAAWQAQRARALAAVQDTLDELRAG